MKNNIREYRQQIGFTMRQLADFCDVSSNTIYRYESNKFQPNAEIIDKLLVLFNCSFDELFIREATQEIDFDNLTFDDLISNNYHSEDKKEAKEMLGRILNGYYSDVV